MNAPVLELTLVINRSLQDRPKYLKTILASVSEQVLEKALAHDLQSAPSRSILLSVTLSQREHS